MKKVLIISYYWPPAGGGGVQRWLKMSKYLPENGFIPVIYTPENGEKPGYDNGLTAEIHPSLIEIKTPIWEPYTLYKSFVGKNKEEKIYNALISGKKKATLKDKVSVFIRGNFFIPDAKCFWIRPSVTYLKQYLAANKIDVIISTGPPHSMHLIAMGIKKDFPDIPWIADFRDPWTMIDFYKDLKLTYFADKYHQYLEKKVLSKADKIISISPSCCADLSKIAKREVFCINNGYDEMDFQGEVKLDEKFTITHVGSMNKDRNPYNLWQAISLIVHENEAFREKLVIQLIGEVDALILESIEKLQLGRYLKHINQLNHVEAILKMRSSQLLMLPINNVDQQKGIMPGKMYEYIASKRPIIGFGLLDSDAAELIKNVKAGIFYTYSDVEKPKNDIERIFNNYLLKRPSNNTDEAMQYSRRHLAKKYSVVMQELISKED